MYTSAKNKGYTKVPNILLNNIMSRRFTSVEIKIIMVIFRYTYGYSRTSAEISGNFIAKTIGSCESVVSRKISRLVKLGVIRICYVNPRTKVRALKINENIEKWNIKEKIYTDFAGENKSEADCLTGADGTASDCTIINHPEEDSNDTGEDEKLIRRLCGVSASKPSVTDNITIYNNIKDDVCIPPRLEKAVIKWLEYKNERGELYGKYALRTLCETICNKAEKTSAEQMTELIDECISAGYKNIVWDRLKVKIPLGCRSFTEDFVGTYDHDILEKLSRAKMRNDKNDDLGRIDNDQ